MEYVFTINLQNLHNFTMKFRICCQDLPLYCKTHIFGCQDLPLYGKTHKFGQPIDLINLYQHIATCRSQQCIDYVLQKTGIQYRVKDAQKYSAPVKQSSTARGPTKLYFCRVFYSATTYQFFEGRNLWIVVSMPGLMEEEQ